MPTKKEIVEQLEELLGTKLASLKRMTKEDLMKLLNILVEPVSLVQIGIRGRKPVIGKIEELIEDPLKGLQLLMELGEKKK